MTGPRRSGPAGVAAGAAMVLAVIALLAGCGGADPAAATSAAPSTSSAGTAAASSAPAAPAVTRVEVRYADGSVVGGVSQRPVPLGNTVDIVVTSDVADEVHLHGYDRKVDVPAGGTATLRFVADISGVFEVELESRSKLLTRLQVS